MFPLPTPPPTIAGTIVAQVARLERREAALGRALADALAGIPRVSDAAEAILAGHAAYRELLAGLVARVRRLVAPGVVRRRTIYRPAPWAPPADPTRPQRLPEGPPE